MADPPATPPPAGPEEGGLILDELSERLTTLAVLREDDPEARGLLLEEIGVRGKAEEDIVGQLSAHRPLWRPDRFEEAHRLAMRSLEVLDRNGTRAAVMPRRVGPLKPVAQWAVQQVTRFVVKDHLGRVIDRLRKLYERREANSAWDSKEHHMLRRARIDAARVEPGYRGKTIGLPGFLLGGAFISGVLSSFIRFVQGALENTLLTVIVGAIAALILIGAAWSAIYGAAVARRRIRLALDQPLRALYETIGACGDPPKDQSINFAVIAIVLFVLAWIVIPAALFFIFT
jgi:hypothetical protein